MNEHMSYDRFLCCGCFVLVAHTFYKKDSVNKSYLNTRLTLYLVSFALKPSHYMIFKSYFMVV